MNIALSPSKFKDKDKDKNESNLILHPFSLEKIIKKQNDKENEILYKTLTANTVNSIITPKRHDENKKTSSENVNFQVIHSYNGVFFENTTKNNSNLTPNPNNESLTKDTKPLCRICYDEGMVFELGTKRDQSISNIYDYINFNSEIKKEKSEKSEGDRQENKEQQSKILISPCNCKGTLKYVHHDCIKTWLKNKISMINEVKCDLCKGIFVIGFEIVKDEKIKKEILLKLVQFVLSFLLIWITLNIVVLLIAVKAFRVEISYENYSLYYVIGGNILILFGFLVYLYFIFKRSLVRIDLNSFVVLDMSDPRYEFIKNNKKDFSMSSLIKEWSYG